MKKLLAMVLALLMLTSLAMPAFADDAPDADPTSSPTTVLHTAIGCDLCQVFSWADRHIMNWTDKVVFYAAKNAKNECPEGYRCIDLFYFVSCGGDDPLVMKYILNGDETCFDAAEEHVATAQELPVTADSEILIMQFVNGAWSEIETEVTENGILFNADTGAIGVFRK